MRFSLRRWLPVVLVISLSCSGSAFAIGIDFLGEVAKPLIGTAKDKAQGIFPYIWLQPYGGYFTGSGSMSETTNSVLSKSGSLSGEGFFYGGRGGLLLARTFKLGVDYCLEIGRDKEDITTKSSGAIVKRELGMRSSMLGFSVGIDVPYTPVQAFAARYLRATLNADGGYQGKGWGAGISFVLANPFIFLAEYRWANFDSDTVGGVQSSKSLKQYFFGLSFLLL